MPVGAHHVESDVSLFKVVVTVGQPIGFWCASSDGNKMVFHVRISCLAGLGIGLVDIRWSVLQFCSYLL